MAEHQINRHKLNKSPVDQPSHTESRRSLFKYGTRGSKYAAATFILSLVAFFDFTQAKDFPLQIYNASLDLKDVRVGARTDAALSMARYDGARTGNWEVNKCMELFIWSPYKAWTSYKPFQGGAGTEPLCHSADTAGGSASGTNKKMKIKCRVKKGDFWILQFWFTEIPPGMETIQVVHMMFTNFFTPWSSQVLKTIEIRYYNDLECQQNQRQVAIPAITIQPGAIPQTNLAVRSYSETHGKEPSKQVLGYKGNDNILEIKFMPVTTMAKQGRGMIEVSIPKWWKVGTAHAFMYQDSSENQCSSNEMRVRSSKVQFGSLKIYYQEMTPEYITGKNIIIRCKQFKNPIFPKKWGGDSTKCSTDGCFTITTYDSENDPKPIEVSVPTALDATTYVPAEITPEQMKIQPINLEIGAGSQWTFYITTPIPMNKGCFIKLTYPSDLVFKYQSIRAQGFFRPDGNDDRISIDKSNNKQWNQAERYIIFKGCNNDNGLGVAPYGRLYMSNFFTPNQIKDSGEFKIAIYKDVDLKELIAKQDKGGYLKARDLSPGSITELAVKPMNNRVQEMTSHRVTFTVSHVFSDNGKIVIKMPDLLTLGDINTKVKIVDKSDDKNLVAVEGTIISSSVIEIYDVFGKENKISMKIPLKLDFEIHSSKNQPSTTDAGDFKIITMTQVDGKFYTVDTGEKKNSFTATAGALKPATATDSAPGASGNDATADSLVVSNPQTYAKDSTWTIKFKAEHAIPNQGYIKLKMPSEVELMTDSTMSGGICAKWSCPSADAKKDELWILVPQTIPAGDETIIEIMGVQNPRTFKPTGVFTLTTYADKISVIDEGFNVGTKMTIPGQLVSFSSTAGSETNGELNKYIFSIITEIPLKDDDKLSYKLPAELDPPTQADLGCKSVKGFVEIECTISGSIVEITFKKFSSPTGNFSWSIENVRNPISTRPSGAFQEIKIQDKDSYQVAAYTDKIAFGIKNKQTAQIVKYKLAQADVRFDDITTYTVKFTPVNAIPSTGSIQITWPQQVTVTSDFVCKLTTNKVHEDSASMCSLNEGSRTLTIKNAFTEVKGFYGNEVTIEMAGIKNPVNNKPGSGFTIMTFDGDKQTYPMDQLKDYLMLPALQCQWPCKECDASGRGRDICTECWQEFQSPYLMKTEGQCKASCNPGYTSNGVTDLNGNLTKKCEKCDDSCVTCLDNNIKGDRKQCIDCNAAAGYPWRITGTQLCVDYCHDSYYASSASTCGKCKTPCKNCEGTESTCTACDKNHKESLSFLWDKQCIFECPVGFTLVKDECKPCKAPCATCVETADKCLRCDGTENTRFVSDSKCYENCPKGTVLSGFDESNCVDCQEEGCDMCEFEDLKSCLLCKKDLFQHEGKCLAVCPEGYKTNNGGTACQSMSLQDLGFIYFPFLIAAFVVCIICIFGMFKRKARIVQGQKVMISTQNTVTAILALIAPLQFLATITQAVFCYIFKVWVHAFLATAVVACFMILNIIFMCVYWRKYQSTYLPEEKTKLVRAGKLSLVEAKKKFQTNSDNEFATYAKRHKCFSVLITVLSLLSVFKLNKLYYSHFYSFSVFKARWSDVKFYRKMMMWFCIAHFITIDLFLICIDVTGLMHIEWGNQIYITMIETLVLSLAGIALGAYELFRLKEYLAYTEEGKKKGMFRVQGGMEDDLMDKDERAHMMKGLLAKVRKNQNLFLNNKLDELLDEFGDRKCKSMINLETGWPKEEDPRQIYTVPLTPKGREQYADGDYKFTKDDAYDLFPDMCGAEAKTAKKFHETGMGADQGQREFIEAQMRKTGAVFNSIEEDDGNRKKRKGARRGRKNKYITQIDAEDEEEAEAVSQSADEREEEAEAQRLAVIKEQEEHEEEMKRQMGIAQEKQNQEKILKKQKQEQGLKLQKENEDREYKERLAREADDENKFKEEARIEKERLLKNDAARAALLAEEAEDKVRKEKADLAAKDKLDAEEKLKRDEYEAAQLALKKKQDDDAEKLRLEKEKADKAKRDADDAEREKLRKEVQDAQDARDEAERQQKLLQMNETDRIAAEAAEKERLRKKKEQDDKEAAEKAILDEKERLRLEKLEADRLAALKKKEDDDRVRASTDNRIKQMEADDLEAKRKQAELDAEAARRRKEEEDKLLQQQEADRLRQEALDKEKALLEQARQVKPVEKTVEKPDEVQAQIDTSLVEMREEPLEDFADQPEPVNIPPYMNQRNFNECDILGDFDRDDKGNIIVLQDDEGNIQDKDGNPTNERGYLMDQSGNILDNHRKRKMFGKEDMDDRGEVPAPYCVEKHNFNPHDIMGDLDFQEDTSHDAASKAKGKPGSKGGSRKNNRGAPSSSGPLVPHLLQANQGFFVDKKGQRINKHGWMTSGNTGNLVDKFGRKKFDKRQLQSDGDFPKLFNYSGKRFDIKDLMGVFNKDGNHKIMLIQSKDGKNFEDNNGRLVNEKGYLIDRNGNVIDAENKKVWWLLKHLKHGEFPKIFPYTKFNIKNIQGDFDLDPLGNPILEKDGSGHSIDRQGRRVNGRGYLIDQEGFIIDKRGKLYFDLNTQDVEGEIPAVFRTGLLKSDTASSLSRLMSEIVRNQSSDFDQEEQAMEQAIEEMKRGENGSGDTSVDSMMGDTPANYNVANQRFDQGDDDEIEEIQEEEESARGGTGTRKRRIHEDPLSPEGEMQLRKIRKKKKKKPKKKIEDPDKFLKPTYRDFQMAGVYGGDAHVSKARPGIKYDRERVIPGHIPKNTAVPVPREFTQPGVGQLAPLANQVAGFDAHRQGSINDSLHHDGSAGGRQHTANKTQPRFREDASQQDQYTQQEKIAMIRRKKAKKARKIGMKDGDFEKMFGENIDQFLEDSEWDVDSFDKMSHTSKNTAQSHKNEMKLKAMEKTYLNRIEKQQTEARGQPAATQSQKKIPKSRKPAPREFQDRFVDDPDYIRRGQQWDFEMDKKGSQEQSSGKKGQSPMRGPVGNNYVGK